jgi:hypothetical protein
MPLLNPTRTDYVTRPYRVPNERNRRFGDSTSRASYRPPARDTVIPMTPRVALVTGASSGIGRACATYLTGSDPHPCNGTCVIGSLEKVWAKFLTSIGRGGTSQD